jgi:beta-lactamase class A
VYVRDIESGQWIGIGEDKLYTPASMLKVPIIIAMLKIAQYNPDLLNKKIFYTRTEDDINPLDNKLLLENGKTYTIENLLEAMIVDSDDAAKKLIRDNVDRVVLNETFADLGIESPYSQDQDGKYSISAKSFSLFFRILYNSTFLSHANSQKVLELLTRTDFDLGIAGGIPKTVTVAHKYGISAISPVGNERVGLNDCGIVYAESGPYLICIMTKGKDPYVLASIMREISKQAYEFLVDNKP